MKGAGKAQEKRKMHTEESSKRSWLPSSLGWGKKKQLTFQRLKGRSSEEHEGLRRLEKECMWPVGPAQARK